MGFRYIGAKSKIIPKIIKKIDRIVEKDSHVTDLMCGTGAVSAALRIAGYNVTAVDIMTYAYHHTRVRLLLDSPPKFEMIEKIINDIKSTQTTLHPLPNYEKIINFLNNIKPVKGYFWREFSPEGNHENTSKSRKYFSSDNAMKIDAASLFIRQLKESNTITDIEYSLLVHDLIMATNDVANIAGTYGHYLSKFVSRALQPIHFKPTKFIRQGSIKKHRVIQGYAEEISKNITCDLCYMDPPYLKRQYAANYHILETLARGDEPEAIGVSGLRPWRDQYSDFCSKVKIRDAFKRIFLNMNCPHFLVSYSEDGLLKKEELENFFSEFGKVKTSSFWNKRFKSNGGTQNLTIKEYLIHVRM